MYKVKIIIFSFIFLLFNPLFAQFSSTKSKNKDQQKPPKSTSKKTILETTKNCIEYDGLFKIYQDKDNAKSFIEIDTLQFNKEFIYFSYIEDGVGDSRNVRGRFRGSKIITIKSYFNKFDF